MLGSCHQSTHIQLDQAIVLEPLGYIPVNHSLGQSLDDDGLADARLADQGRVVLGTAGQDLDRTADFLLQIPVILCQALGR
jgi:hypothetical protein